MAQGQLARDQRIYTAAEVAAIRETTYRDGYGDGVEAEQLTRARKPCLIEQESWDRWQAQHPLS